MATLTIRRSDLHSIHQSPFSARLGTNTRRRGLLPLQSANQLNMARHNNRGVFKGRSILEGGLEDQVEIAKGELDGGAERVMHDKLPSAQAGTTQPVRGPVEVPIVDLMVHNSRKHGTRSRGISNDFEFVPRFKNVLALHDDKEFAPAPSLGPTSPALSHLDDGDDDGWELVDGEGNLIEADANQDKKSFAQAVAKA